MGLDPSYQKAENPVHMMARWIISAALLLALTLSGLGHHSTSPDKQAQATAYILAGGNWADLCSDGTNPTPTGNKCLACVIGPGCTLPGHANTPQKRAGSVGLAWNNGNQINTQQIQSTAHSARAPPFLVI